MSRAGLSREDDYARPMTSISLRRQSEAPEAVLSLYINYYCLFDTHFRSTKVYIMQANIAPDGLSFHDILMSSCHIRHRLAINTIIIEFTRYLLRWTKNQTYCVALRKKKKNLAKQRFLFLTQSKLYIYIYFFNLFSITIYL